jgi:hypothetical protein
MDYVANDAAAAAAEERAGQRFWYHRVGLKKNLYERLYARTLKPMIIIRRQLKLKRSTIISFASRHF